MRAWPAASMWLRPSVMDTSWVLVCGYVHLDGNRAHRWRQSQARPGQGQRAGLRPANDRPVLQQIPADVPVVVVGPDPHVGPTSDGHREDPLVVVLLRRSVRLCA